MDVMMGNNFSLFGSFKRAKRLRRFYKMTSKNALIIAASNDIYIRHRNLSTSTNLRNARLLFI